MRQYEFCYATAITTLTTTQTLVPQINISNDNDFEVHEIRAVIVMAATAIDAPGATVTLLAALASGELFSNVAINILSFAAQSMAPAAVQSNFSGYPIRLPNFNMRLYANDQVNHTITNNTSGTITVQIQYWGTKVPHVNQ